MRSDKVLDELTAVRTALRRAMPGDLVVCCVDDAIAVYREVIDRLHDQPGARVVLASHP